MVFDIGIIGTGPAGMTAGIYAGRDRLETIHFEAENVGGQLPNRHQLPTYPGFPGVVSGTDLRSGLVEQIQEYDPTILLTRVEAIEEDRPFVVRTGDGTDGYTCRAVIIAGGCRSEKLDVPGAETYAGRGVFYCAKCDGPLYEDRVVAVVGDGNRAVDDALYLTEYASEVHLVAEASQLSAAKSLRKRVETHEQVSIHQTTGIKRLTGDEDVLETIELVDRAGNRRRVDCDGVLIQRGLVPNTEYLESTVALDEQGHVVVDAKLETTVPGIFAAGDIRQYAPHSVASAVGDGLVAFQSAKRRLEERS